MSIPDAFTKCVSRGGLVLASQPVFKILQYSEKCFRFFVNSTNGNVQMSTVYAKCVDAVSQHFALVPRKVFGKEHSIVTCIELEDLHETILINDLASTYLSLRLRAHAKRETIRSQGKTATIRQKLTKLVTFFNV